MTLEQVLDTLPVDVAERLANQILAATQEHLTALINPTPEVAAAQEAVTAAADLVQKYTPAPVEPTPTDAPVETPLDPSLETPAA